MHNEMIAALEKQLAARTVERKLKNRELEVLDALEAVWARKNTTRAAIGRGCR
jgi:hypothetical protein